MTDIYYYYVNSIGFDKTVTLYSTVIKVVNILYGRVCSGKDICEVDDSYMMLSPSAESPVFSPRRGNVHPKYRG